MLRIKQKSKEKSNVKKPVTNTKVRIKSNVVQPLKNGVTIAKIIYPYMVRNITKATKTRF